MKFTDYDKEIAARSDDLAPSDEGAGLYPGERVYMLDTDYLVAVSAKRLADKTKGGQILKTWARVIDETGQTVLDEDGERLETVYRHRLDALLGRDAKQSAMIAKELILAMLGEPGTKRKDVNEAGEDVEVELLPLHPSVRASMSIRTAISNYEADTGSLEVDGLIGEMGGDAPVFLSAKSAPGPSWSELLEIPIADLDLAPIKFRAAVADVLTSRPRNVPPEIREPSSDHRAAAPHPPRQIRLDQAISAQEPQADALGLGSGGLGVNWPKPDEPLEQWKPRTHLELADALDKIEAFNALPFWQQMQKIKYYETDPHSNLSGDFCCLKPV